MNSLAKIVLVALGLLFASQANAQFNGTNTLGDFGLASGSQPAPGFYASAFYYRYETDELRDRLGDSILPDVQADLSANAWAGVLYYVSDYKILGGTYGFQAVLAGSNSHLEAPLLGTDDRASSKFGDLYLQPIGLGWNTSRTDFHAGLGLTIPTGDYEFLGDSNGGLGMYSYEIFGGFTHYLDDAKAWNIATTAFYETHGKKDDTNIRVGDLLTLEGGIGYSFLEGTASVGLAYYAQWKTSADKLGEAAAILPPELAGIIDKHSVYGAGPELNFPVPYKNRLVALVNLRYFREFGAKTKSEGDTFTLTITFPIPSVPLS